MPWMSIDGIINRAAHTHRYAMNRLNRVGHAWQSRAWEHPWAVSQLPPPPADLADFGCGDRPFPPYLAELGYRVTANDKIEHGKDGPIWGLPPKWREEHSERLRYVKADMTDLPFPDDRFDAGICISVFEHMNGEAEVRAALREMLRVLRPGTPLICTGDVRALEPSPFWLAAVKKEGLWTPAMERAWHNPPNSRIWIGEGLVTCFGFVIGLRSQESETELPCRDAH